MMFNNTSTFEVLVLVLQALLSVFDSMSERLRKKDAD